MYLKRIKHAEFLNCIFTHGQANHSSETALCDATVS